MCLTSPSYSRNTAPRITLNTTIIPATFNLTYGLNYTACTRGVQPTLAKPCEPGASATDQQDGNDTSKVVACPSAGCKANASLCTGKTPGQLWQSLYRRSEQERCWAVSAAYQCRPSKQTEPCLAQIEAAGLLSCCNDGILTSKLCRQAPQAHQLCKALLAHHCRQFASRIKWKACLGHIVLLRTNRMRCSWLVLVFAGQEFAEVGLQNCHINSSLPVGTVLQIPFLVWDNGQPPLSATVNRTLVITAPCATGVLSYSVS